MKQFPEILSDELVVLQRLQVTDFDALYAVASDPLIWEQHPNPDRYQRSVFQIYFDGAIASGGAYLIHDKATGAVIGCSRFYDHDKEGNEIKIGYTFFARNVWGKGYNPAVKRLMLIHAFQFVDCVIFHVGAENRRSQIAMERIGGQKIGEEPVAYYGERVKLNIVYVIEKETFLTTSR